MFYFECMTLFYAAKPNIRPCSVKYKAFVCDDIFLPYMYQS